MRVPRIYTPQVLHENCEITLEESASHHCLKVLRMDVGRKLVLFNGDGAAYPAEIISKSKKQADVSIQLKAPSSETVRESSLQSHLAISISRGERFDFVLQKATELGVTEITPLFTERTEVKLQGDRLDKKLSSWQKILISACEQCGRNVIPTLNLPQAFEPFIRSAQAEQKFVLHHRNTVSPSNATTAKSVLLLVGPEGGLSEQEIAAASEHDFQNLALGPRVLRTETAPLAALSIFQFLWGDI